MGISAEDIEEEEELVRPKNARLQEGVGSD
jgi:hypothetical protein